jgi:Phage P22-like portal protein
LSEDQERSSLTPKKDEKLLKEIRDRFEYCHDYWKDIRDEGEEDMRYASGDPWPPEERAARKAAFRPIVSFDEIGQYVNQLVNDIRQNKRAVKVVPRGQGANDKTADLRGDLIREIEYKSNAQSAYSCGFENMCTRSYGGWRIVRRYVSEKSFDQEIRIVRIPNPDSSYPDPDCKESDYSDAMFWFLLDLIPRKEYKRKYPKAKIADFTSEDMKVAPGWIKQDQIQVAEYWRVEETKRNLLHVKVPGTNPGDPSSFTPMFEDELPDNVDIEELRKAGKIKGERETTQRKIVQYITNGLEILERNEEPGKYIPIVWLTGKEMYVNSGLGPKRILMSLIRLARDPQMLLNYYRSTESELVGMTPKTPWIGVVGQFHKPELWEASINTPVAYLEYKAKVDGVDGLLPPPMRNPYTPEIQALEMGAESARRAIQAAMGLSGMPTIAQKQNDKSGVALKEIDENEDKGSFHFIDNFEMALEHSGRIINDKIPFVYDGPREIGARNSKDEHRTVKVNQESKNEKGETENNDLTVGEHEVTISTGPSYQSEREAADEFVKTIVPELEGLDLPPQIKMKLLALLVKSQDIGPMGEEISKLLDPPDQTAAQLQQSQQQVQQYQQQLAEMMTENQKLELEKKAKVIDNEYMMKKAEMDNKLKLDIAEITTKAQDKQSRDALTQDLLKELHVQAASAAEQAVQHAHEKHIESQKAATAQQSQTDAQEHEAEMAANQPAGGAE